MLVLSVASVSSFLEFSVPDTTMAKCETDTILGGQQRGRAIEAITEGGIRGRYLRIYAELFSHIILLKDRHLTPLSCSDLS